MNGKTAKLLRKIGRNTTIGKKMWNEMNHSQRGETRRIIKLSLEDKIPQPEKV